MAATSLPVVDLEDLRRPERRAEAVSVLGAALERLGFVAVTGHGIPDGLIEAAYGVARETFALSGAAKLRYERPDEGRQRGYTAFGVEHAKNTQVADLKEFWHVGPELDAEHPLRVRGVMPQNVFPEEVAAFEAVFMDLFGQLEAVAFTVLGGLASYLGESEQIFGRLAKDGNSVLRIIHYPDVGHVPKGAVRAAAHEDINLLTLLPSSTGPGLELMTREGQWMAVEAPAGALICDTGDMMQLLTAGRIPATTHRVVNPVASDGGRLSMPFFLHPHPDAVLEPILPGFSEPVTVREYFSRRLKETGVQ